jgi:hypothetical protein
MDSQGGETSASWKVKPWVPDESGRINMDILRAVAGVIIAVFVLVPILFALAGAAMHLWKRWKVRDNGTGRH